jgi:hypothetical protein
MEYNVLASDELVVQTIEALKVNGMEGQAVATRAEALALIKEVIPAGASVMNGSSRTLEEIGFIDYLRAGQHGWNNVHEAVLLEQDKIKQAMLRKQALLADYYLGSVHALSAAGEFLVASNTGSQLPHLVFSSANLILVVGRQKIVADLAAAMRRLEDYVVPKEDARAMKEYGQHTMLAKILIFKKENPAVGRKVRIIIVNEELGF